ncbi:MAG: G5 domain-containing protein [Peptococcaceae bacterium]|nr:G5 domain-containing protein [Peptococcaceae bacterium]
MFESNNPMDLCPLSTHIGMRSLNAEETVKLGIHICRALEAYHQNTIIHKNVTFGNIFVTPSGNFRLGDFDNDGQLQRTPSDILNNETSLTMAPEVFRNDPYDANADTYSLGILMYIILNGNRAPFLPRVPHGISPEDHTIALVRRIKGEPLPALPDISPELNALVLKACSYQRGDRFGSSAEMRQALERIALPAQSQVHPTHVPKVHIIPTALHADLPFRAEGPRHINPPMDADEPDDPDDPIYTRPIFDEPSVRAKDRLRFSDIWLLDLRLYKKIRIPLIVSTFTLIAITVVLASLTSKPGPGYGISINGQTEMVFSDKKEAEDVLLKLAEYYVLLAGAGNMTITSVDYEESVEIVKTKESTAEIRDKEEALRALVNGINVIIQGYCEMTEDIIYETETLQDDDADLNTIQVRQEGENGTKSARYTYLLKNGAIIEKTLLAETVIKEPVKEIILAGTKPATGQNLSHGDMARIFEEVGKAKNIPPEILKAIGWVESTWRQFDPQGNPRLGGGVYAGIMQVDTQRVDEDTLYKLKYDIRFNIEYGADILIAKWNAVPKIGNGDKTILENWYFALWAYNGLFASNNPNQNPGNTYQHKILKAMANPQYPAVPVTVTPYTDVPAGASQPSPGGTYPTPAPAHYSYELTGKTDPALSV